MLSATSLLSLLPLLALVSAFPFDPSSPSRIEARQQNGNNTASPGAAAPLSFQAVGDAGISAQMVRLFYVRGWSDANFQMWLGNNKKVYILDKTENNPVSITGKFGTHPAWAVEYDIASNTCTSGFIDTLDVADQQTVRWMSFPTLSVPVVLSLVTVPGPSLVATSVSIFLVSCMTLLTTSGHDWRCRNYHPRQLHEHGWRNRHPST